MATESIQATGIDSVVPDSLRQEIQIGFMKPDGFVLVVHLPFGASAELILRLQSCSDELDLLEGDKFGLAQPVRLQEARPFALADGRRGLVLKMRHLQVPLLLANEQIEALKIELEELPDLRIDTDHRQ